MANALYTKGKQHILAGDIDFDANTIKVCLIDHTDDTPVPATDEFVSDIDGGVGQAGIVGTPGTLAGVSVTGGVLDGTDQTFSTVSGDQFESVNLYKSVGTRTTDILLLYIDTATGLPCTPNGGDITVAWDNGGNKIFAL